MLPLIFVPSAIKDINDGVANYSVIGINIGTSLALGTILTLTSKALYRTTVPKKYNLKEWKISTLEN